MGLWRTQFAFACVIGVAVAMASPLHAATPAGSAVENTAVVSLSNGAKVESEADTFVVDELNSLTLVFQGQSPVAVASPSQQVLAYTLTHTGNGREHYDLAFANLADDNFDAESPELWLDSDGDGVFDPSVDQLYDPDNPPELTPNQSLVLFVRCNVPADLAINDLANTTLTATAVGAGELAGTAHAYSEDGGDNGVGLLLGNEGGQAVAAVALEVQNNASLGLVKTQSVRDPEGGSEPVPGAVISYTLSLALSGVGELTDIVITDVVPEHTHFIPNSLKIDGAAMTDTDDADRAHYDSANRQVYFNLGDVVAPHDDVVLVFDVVIQ